MKLSQAFGTDNPAIDPASKLPKEIISEIIHDDCVMFTHERIGDIKPHFMFKYKDCWYEAIHNRHKLADNWFVKNYSSKEHWDDFNRSEYHYKIVDNALYEEFREYLTLEGI